MSGGFSRDKGKRGEREVAAMISDLLGMEVKRRVRQHEGDSDLMGIPDWSIEVKNCATLSLPAWWRQTVEQAGDMMPVLFYKIPRKGWRCMWPISCLLVYQEHAFWKDMTYAVDTTPETWATVVRELIEMSEA